MSVPPEVRPTEGRVREALFSIWADRIRGARFLDLFAGSGAVGLEALSRGAGEVVFVESDRRISRALHANAAGLAESDWRVITARLPEGLERLEGRTFGFVFLDPPYRFEDHSQVVEAAAGLLGIGGCLAVEHATRVRLAAAVGGLRRADERVYGDSALTFFEV